MYIFFTFLLILCHTFVSFFFFLIIRRPPRYTLTDTLFPYTTLFRSDERLFRLLLGDLFPNLELPQIEHQDLKAAVELELASKQLQAHPFLLSKIGQLYDSKQTRHCNMLVGQSYGGKSRSEEHTSELQSLMRISYAVFCLKKKKK